MSDRPLVLVPNDPRLNTCLDPVAETLAASGIEVRRPVSLSPPDWGNDIPRAAAIVLTPRTLFSRRELDAAKSLRGIAFPTIGVEALDLAAATELGIAVGFGATDQAVASIAEANVMLIAAMLLGLDRKARALREEGWRAGSITGRMVQGRVIGCVGFGRIARATIHRLANWGVSVRYFDPYIDPATVPADFAARCETLDAVLRDSDVVLVMAELTPETEGMIGEAQLRLMRKDAILVNTARGAVVDEAALARALAERRIAGAALDAFAVEPLPDGSPLRRLDNAMLTPHCIGHTMELHESFVPATLANVTRILRGEAPLYFKNPQVLQHWKARMQRLGIT